MTHKPDRWVILEVDTGTEKIKRCLSGWYGGYLHGDSWRLSTDIKELEETDGGYRFSTRSGTKYEVSNRGYGMTGMTASIYAQMLEEVKGTSVTVRILEDFDPS